MKRFVLCITAAFLLLVTTGSASARKWTDGSGKFSVEAELVKVENGRVTLKKSGGKIVEITLTKLSKADRDYLADLTKFKEVSDEAKRAHAKAVAAIKKVGGSVEEVSLPVEEIPPRIHVTFQYKGTDEDLKHLQENVNQSLPPRRGQTYQPRATPWDSRTVENLAPKGRHNLLLNHTLCRPFRAYFIPALVPRALPWAGMLRPVGAKSNLFTTSRG